MFCLMMLKKDILSFSLVSNKTLLVLFWVALHAATTFPGSGFGSVCVFLLKQNLVEVIKRSYDFVKTRI